MYDRWKSKGNFVKIYPSFPHIEVEYSSLHYIAPGQLHFKNKKTSRRLTAPTFAGLEWEENIELRHIFSVCWILEVSQWPGQVWRKCHPGHGAKYGQQIQGAGAGAGGALKEPGRRRRAFEDGAGTEVLLKHVQRSTRGAGARSGVLWRSLSWCRKVPEGGGAGVEVPWCSRKHNLSFCGPSPWL